MNKYQFFALEFKLEQEKICILLITKKSNIIFLWFPVS